jgi:murein DD-endopeptidase MepM/ murein hydrolase activator NlpD
MFYNPIRMVKIIVIICELTLSLQALYAQIRFPAAESGYPEDMLTPEYYLAEEDAPLRKEINTFIFFCQAEPFQHPLENPTGEIPSYSTPPNGEFGAGKGPTGTSQHHAAIDLHVGNRDTLVQMYAAHEGLVRVYRDAPKYRHYLSITKNITDSAGNMIGKMVTLYAHLNLELDSADNLILDGEYINQGDLVSGHLYSGTVGGPHLHFEIRYYRPGDDGNEEFYGVKGFGNNTLTIPSAGSWSYGFWNPDVGYGFGHPEEYINKSSTTEAIKEFGPTVRTYPNPTEDFVTVELDNIYSTLSCSIFNLCGQLLDEKTIISSSSVKVNLTDYSPGTYLIQLTDNMGNDKAYFKVIRE